VIVPDDQLSLAIGKDGLNARLAARLTGWRVDIRSETEFAEEEAEMGYQEEEVSGRCAAILANGKRCPNASLPGSRYCGIPAHQELEDKDTDYVVPPSGGDGEAEPEEPASDEEPSAQEVVDGQPSVEDLVAEQPSVDEIVGEEPSVEEVVEAEPSRDEVVGAELSPDEVAEGEPSVEEIVGEAPSDEDTGTAPSEVDAGTDEHSGSEETKQS
jgi:transcription termination/antitermination protein NusA